MGRRHFTPDLFAFLGDLSANNDRAWFKANQARYEASVREPALEFIIDFATPLERISPHFVADARTVGGSLFRIQRDTRFAKDKTPYKTNTGVQFRHEAAGDAHAPGFYLHLQPGESFMAAGLWRPDTATAYAIRAAISDDPDGWLGAVGGKRFTETMALTGDSLVRPPRGYDPDHPLIEDLKRKDFIASTRLDDAEVVAEGFLDSFVARCRVAAPLLEFLCGAVGVPF